MDERVLDALVLGSFVAFRSLKTQRTPCVSQHETPTTVDPETHFPRKNDAMLGFTGVFQIDKS